VTIRDETGRKPQLYHYRDGYYHSDGWLIVEHKAKEILGKYWSIKYRNEILDYLKTENIINRNDIQINPNLINVKNGVYDIETDELLPHDSKYIFLYKVPWEYNPKATCPKIMKFFESTLEPEFVKISLEIFGYCLYSNYFIPSVFYLYGTGGNGKSVWSTLLTNMLGANNTTAIEVHSIFENRFSAAALFGKLANVCGEIDQKAFVKTSIIKDITGGNYISAELKGRDSFTFKNTAKIISSCNVMPYCKDLSTGWTDRQYVVPFLKKFRGESSEKMSLGDILSNDTKEMEGLLKTSIDALKILVKQKKFSYEGYREKYSDTQAGAKDFLTLMIERTNNAEDYLTNQEIYEKCNAWCTAKKIPTPSANSLSRELTYAEFKTDILWIDGKTLRIKRFCKWRESESLRNSTGEN
jgi:P4 family phage/plasmid primase-like protien